MESMPNGGFYNEDGVTGTADAFAHSEDFASVHYGFFGFDQHFCLSLSGVSMKRVYDKYSHLARTIYDARIVGAIL